MMTQFPFGSPALLQQEAELRKQTDTPDPDDLLTAICNLCNDLEEAASLLQDRYPGAASRFDEVVAAHRELLAKHRANP